MEEKRKAIEARVPKLEIDGLDKRMWRLMRCAVSLSKQSRRAWSIVYRVVQKWHARLYTLTSPNIDRFPNLFRCQNQV